MEYVSCNLCGRDNPKVLLSLPDFLLNRRDKCNNIVECQSCGLVYQNPRPIFDEILEHYPPEYESYISSEDRETNILFKQMIQYGLSKRANYITKYSKQGRLLDVGCATGVFLNGMRTRGRWDLFGVELNNTAAQVARDKFGLNIFTGTIQQASLPSEYFDVVTLWDVLEHLYDPTEALEEVKRVLRKNGILVLRVPNGNCRDVSLFGKYWAGYDSPRHLYVFTPETIRELLKKSGFRVEKWDTNSGGYPTFLLSLRFWLSESRVSPKVREYLVKTLYHPISKMISAPLFFIRGLGLKGPQLVVTVVKDH